MRRTSVFPPTIPDVVAYVASAIQIGGFAVFLVGFAARIVATRKGNKSKRTVPIVTVLVSALVTLVAFGVAIYYWRFPLIIPILVGATLACVLLFFVARSSLRTDGAKVSWAIAILCAFALTTWLVLSATYPILTPRSVTPPGPTPPILTPGTTPVVPPNGHTETASAGGASTFTNFANAGGTVGPRVAAYQTIQVACKVMGFKVADGNPWWYRVASSPWNGAYYASADSFYNNGETSGSLLGTPWVDPNVPNC
jgi:hypothetical protein